MILDYTYDSRKKNFSISYIKEDGMKSLLNFNVSRFKAFYKTPTGKYKNWDGSNCDVRWTDRPSKFEYKTFMKELDPKYKSLLAGKYNPKLYTFDIETMVVNDEFPEPSEAKFPITTISIANPNCDVIILGTRKLDEVGQEYLQNEFSKYVKDTEFFHTLGLKLPTIKYVYFESEEAMLRYFLKNIVSKVPVLAGWNSILFDWQYIQNRVRFYYPDISLASCSTSYTTHRKNYKDKKEQTVTLTLPDHTLVIDMMDVIDQFDMVVMPIKDSLSLDYIASESIGANKIKYDGSLDDLYNNDYAKYVFYNAIDSFLVQLIDKKFKTLNIICTQSLVCHEKIESCFSKIAITEAMFWHYFYDNGIKCVYENKEDVERGRLIGAYVRIPTPGKHKLICCNDFASLYPSTIITCNLSIENFVGTFYDEEALKPFKDNPTDYIVVGANVHKNKGTLAKPELGDFIAKYLLEDELDVYRKDPRYFVSVNGSVYKNDKDYSFKCIESKLKSDRNVSKYLAKQLEAEVITDIDHIRKGYTIKDKAYPENIVHAIAELGYQVNMSSDMLVWDENTLNEFERKLKNEITYLTSAEQAYKLIGNSMYGGSSHVAFFWFNMALANDITGEARNIIHKMESHIPEYLKKAWPSMKEFHKKYNIELDEKFVESILNSDKSFVSIAYGDSCVGETIIQTVNGPMMIKDMFNDSNIVFHDRGKDFGLFDNKIINYNGCQNIESNVKYIIRHKTSKSKWIITDDQHNEIIVTGDHSMIIIENSIMKVIRPSEMKVGMILKTLNGFSKVVSIINDGNFDNEYVYDIEVYTNNDNEHNFYGNNILIHNTDSITGDSIIHTSEGDKTIEQMFNENYNNNLFHTHKGHELVSTSDKVLNWDNNLYYGDVKYIMRHKVSKPKWRLKTKDGKEIVVTNDHSMIVFRDGEKLEVKPYEILPSDKVLIVKK